MPSYSNYPVWSTDTPRLVGCNAIIRHRNSAGGYVWTYPTVLVKTKIASLRLDTGTDHSGYIKLSNGYKVRVTYDSSGIYFDARSDSTVEYRTSEVCRLTIYVSTSGNDGSQGGKPYNAATNVKLSIPVCAIQGPLNTCSVQYTDVGSRDYVIGIPIGFNHTHPPMDSTNTIILDVSGSGSKAVWRGPLEYPTSAAWAFASSDSVHVHALSVNDAIYRDGLQVVSVIYPAFTTTPSNALTPVTGPKRHNLYTDDGMTLIHCAESSDSSHPGYTFYRASSKFTIPLMKSNNPSSGLIAWVGSSGKFQYSVQRIPTDHMWRLIGRTISNSQIVWQGTLGVANALLSVSNSDQRPPSAGWTGGVTLNGSAVLYDADSSNARAYDYIGENYHSDSRSGSVHVAGKHLIQYFQARKIYHPSFQHWGEFAGHNVSGGATVSYDADTGVYRRGIIESHIYDLNLSSSSTVLLRPICGFGVLRAPALAAEAAGSIYRDYVVMFPDDVSAGTAEGFGVGPGTGVSSYYLMMRSKIDTQAAQLYGWYYKHRHATPYTGTSSDVIYKADVSAIMSKEIQYYCMHTSYTEDLGPGGPGEINEFRYVNTLIDIHIDTDGDGETADIDLPICISSDDIIEELKSGDISYSTRHNTELPTVLTFNSKYTLTYARLHDGKYRRDKYAVTTQDDTVTITDVFHSKKNNSDSTYSNVAGLSKINLYGSVNITPFTGPDPAMASPGSDTGKQEPLFISGGYSSIKGDSDSQFARCTCTTVYRYEPLSSDSTLVPDSSSDTFTGKLLIPSFLADTAGVYYSRYPSSFTPEPGATFSPTSLYRPNHEHHNWHVAIIERERDYSTNPYTTHVKKYEVTEFYVDRVDTTNNVPYVRYCVDPGIYTGLTEHTARQGDYLVIPTSLDSDTGKYYVRGTNYYESSSSTAPAVTSIKSKRIEYGEMPIEDVFDAINGVKTEQISDSEYYSDSQIIDETTRFQYKHEKHVFSMQRYGGAAVPFAPISDVGATYEQRPWRDNYGSDSNTYKKICTSMSSFKYLDKVQIQSSSSSTPPSVTP